MKNLPERDARVISPYGVFSGLAFGLALGMLADGYANNTRRERERRRGAAS